MQYTIKNIWQRTVFIAGGILAIFGVIDYINKWGITAYITNNLIVILKILINDPFIIFLTLVILWLLFLTIKLRVLVFKSQLEEVSNPDFQKIFFELQEAQKTIKVLREDAVHTRSTFEKEVRFLKSQYSELQNDAYEIKRESLRTRAEKHEKEGEEGRILCRIRLLELDIKKDWDFNIHETLEEILECVRKYKMFSQSAAELRKQLLKLPVEYDHIKHEIETSIKIQ